MYRSSNPAKNCESESIKADAAKDYSAKTDTARLIRRARRMTA